MLMIDLREDSKLSSQVENKAIIANVKIEKRYLEIGDYVCGNICIEAKSVEDFLASVRNKRVFNQLSNMEDAYEKNILLVYGNLSKVGSYLNHTSYNSPGWQGKLQKMFVGALSSITINTSIKTVWVTNTSEAAEFIVATAYHAKKDFKLTKMLPKKTRTDDARVDLLCTIKGISPKKAKQLLEDHLSILEVAMQDAKTLSNSEGIGKVTASNIVDIFNSEEEVKY